MDPIVKEFVTSHEIGCLAVEEISGGLHAAAIHYTVTDAGTFYIQTNLDSRKCSLLKEKGRVKAAFVSGFSEEEWKTYQASGHVRLVTDPIERRNFSDTRQKQFPGPDYTDDPEVAFLEFIPNWWRYTDSNTKPKTIIEG